MKIINVSQKVLLAGEARMADSFFSRLRGLLGTKQLSSGLALIIKPCSSIHTIGMVYNIDVLFVDKDNTVLKIVTELGPWRLAACSGSKYVIELPAGTSARSGTSVGDKLSLVPDKKIL